VSVAGDHDDDALVDGEARGRGCDIAAWLCGRDPRGSAISATGDLAVLRLPQWFPFGWSLVAWPDQHPHRLPHVSPL
jgi:hypothetical protein